MGTIPISNVGDRTYYQTVGYASGGHFYGTPREWMLTLRGQF